MVTPDPSPFHTGQYFTFSSLLQSSLYDPAKGFRTKNWTATYDSTKYYQISFTTTQYASYISIDSIFATVEQNASGTNFVQIRYSFNSNFSGSVQLGTQTTIGKNISTYIKRIPVGLNVNSGSTIYIRLYMLTAGGSTFFCKNFGMRGKIFGCTPTIPVLFNAASPVCPNADSLQYSLVNSPAATSYSWTVPAGWTIQSGSGTNSIRIRSGSNSQDETLTVTATNACGTGNPLSIPVTMLQAPVINNQTGGPVSTCPFIPDSITVSAGGSALTYQWRKSSDAGTTWTDISDDADYAGSRTGKLQLANLNPDFSGYRYKLVITNSQNCIKESNPVLFLVKNIWNGNLSNSWNQAGNWADNNTPTSSCENVIIRGGRPFQPVIQDSASVTNIQIMNGANLSVTGKIKISGEILNDGIFNLNAGTLELNGNQNQNISANEFQNHTLKNLKISNPAGATISGTANEDLRLTGILSFGNVNTTLNTGNHLVLASDSNGTASIADLSNGGINNNSVTGDVTVERFIKNARKWQFLSIPTNSGQTFRQSWQENNAAGQNILPGYGTMITDNSAGWSSLGFDAQTPGGPSIKRFDAASNGFIGIPNTLSMPINTPNTYMAYIRGDRSATPYNTIKTYTVLRTKGPVKQGTQAPIPIPANTFVDIGNPFPSTIDIDKVTKPGVQDFIYLWDPFLGGTYGAGAYQTLVNNLDGTYYATPGGGSYPPFGTPYNEIQSGQGFFVRGANGGQVVMEENDKIPETRSVLRPGAGSLPPTIRMQLWESSGSTGNYAIIDGVLINYSPDFSNNVDYLDALALSHAGPNFSITRNGQMLAVERRNTLQTSDTIFLNTEGMRAGDFQLKIFAHNWYPENKKIFIHDTYLNTKTGYMLTDSIICGYSINTDPASAGANRFFIIFRPGQKKQVLSIAPHIPATAVNSGENNSPANFRTMPNPVTGNSFKIRGEDAESGKYDITVSDMNGNKINSLFAFIRTTGDEITVKLPKKIPNGNYAVTMTNPSGGKIVYSTKIILAR